jgi:hypothetical protein
MCYGLRGTITSQVNPEFNESFFFRLFMHIFLFYRQKHS